MSQNIFSFLDPTKSPSYCQKNIWGIQVQRWISNWKCECYFDTTLQIHYQAVSAVRYLYFLFSDHNSSSRGHFVSFNSNQTWFLQSTRGNTVRSPLAVEASSPFSVSHTFMKNRDIRLIKAIAVIRKLLPNPFVLINRICSNQKSYIKFSIYYPTIIVFVQTLFLPLYLNFH